MPVLAKTKTWVKYSALISEGDGPTPQAGQTQGRSDRRLIMYMIKTQMLAAGWTVVRSCGFYVEDIMVGPAWHYGPADHWPDADSVRWKEADNKFGWIVLKNTALHNVGNGFQVCFALTQAASGGNNLDLLFSCEGGFSGGDETSRPTATDEVSLISSGALFNIPGVSLPYFLNIWYSTDGQCFRMHQGRVDVSGQPQLMFEKLQDPPSWLDKPVLAAFRNWSRTDLSHTTTTAKINFCCDEFLGQVASFAIEMDKANNLLSNATIFQTADADGNWSVFPVSIISLSHLVPGYLGKIADFWFAPSAIPQYNYMPSSGTKEFVVINQMLIGNDGTSVIY